MDNKNTTSDALNETLTYLAAARKAFIAYSRDNAVQCADGQVREELSLCHGAMNAIDNAIFAADSLQDLRTPGSPKRAARDAEFRTAAYA